jgi:outer membrane biosynthesis protein TonB
MYFDFEDHRPDITPVGRAISWREGVLISIIIHMAIVIVLLTAPQWLVSRVVRVPDTVVAEVKDKDEPLTFVFVQPRVDVPAPKPPPRADLSDKDRVARAPERAEAPTNPLPYSRGNSRELAEALEAERARGRGPVPEPSTGPPAEPAPPDNAPVPEQQSALALPGPPPQSTSGAAGRAPAGGSLGDALRNLERYVQNQQLNNPRGGNANFGPAIQFDTMGVDFGRWIMRFKAQVERNWFPLIPQAAMSMSGHTVLTFNVHKNGMITDLTIAKPSRVDGFNYAAYGAMVSSNPTIPLPAEYPADRAFFTVTFFYNEAP